MQLLDHVSFNPFSQVNNSNLSKMTMIHKACLVLIPLVRSIIQIQQKYDNAWSDSLSFNPFSQVNNSNKGGKRKVRRHLGRFNPFSQVNNSNARGACTDPRLAGSSFNPFSQVNNSNEIPPEFRKRDGKVLIPLVRSIIQIDSKN